MPVDVNPTLCGAGFQALENRVRRGSKVWTGCPHVQTPLGYEPLRLEGQGDRASGLAGFGDEAEDEGGPAEGGAAQAVAGFLAEEELEAQPLEEQGQLAGRTLAE